MAKGTGTPRTRKPNSAIRSIGERQVGENKSLHTKTSRQKKHAPSSKQAIIRKKIERIRAMIAEKKKLAKQEKKKKQKKLTMKEYKEKLGITTEQKEESAIQRVQVSDLIDEKGFDGALIKTESRLITLEKISEFTKIPSAKQKNNLARVMGTRRRIDLARVEGLLAGHTIKLLKKRKGKKLILEKLRESVLYSILKKLEELEASSNQNLSKYGKSKIMWMENHLIRVYDMIEQFSDGRITKILNLTPSEVVISLGRKRPQKA